MDLFDLLFPKNCVSCHRYGKYICSGCLDKVTKANFVCPVCKNYSLYGVTHKYCKDQTCLDGVVAVWRYEGVIRKAITRLKYNFNYDIAKELADLFSQQIQKNRFDSFLITPIPIHKDRQKWRGFNQAEMLAKRMSQNLSLNLQKNLLIKTKATTPQVKLPKSERLRSIRGIFAVNNVPASEDVIVFDDVWTTGATLNEAAKVLKIAGVKKVWGMVLAR